MPIKSSHDSLLKHFPRQKKGDVPRMKIISFVGHPLFFCLPKCFKRLSWGVFFPDKLGHTRLHFLIGHWNLFLNPVFYFDGLRKFRSNRIFEATQKHVKTSKNKFWKVEKRYQFFVQTSPLRISFELFKSQRVWSHLPSWAW